MNDREAKLRDIQIEVRVIDKFTTPEGTEARIVEYAKLSDKAIAQITALFEQETGVLVREAKKN